RLNAKKSLNISGGSSTTVRTGRSDSQNCRLPSQMKLLELVTPVQKILDDQIHIYFEEWMKMATDNKINVKIVGILH
ncbi:11248_t:CDS:2, partial [Funneliformis caledonium]